LCCAFDCESPEQAVTLLRMTTQGEYWNLDECRWVRWTPEPGPVAIPEQPVPVTAAAEGDALPA
jgi:hypothetical protein